MYNWRDDWENRFRFTVTNLEDAYDNGDFTTSGGDIYQALGTVEREVKGGKDTDRIDSRRLEDQRNSNISLRGEHLIANKLKLWWSGTYASASEERPYERYILYAGEEVPVTVDLRDSRKPNVLPAQENSWQELELDELTEQYGNTWEEDYNGKIDLQLPVSKLGIIKFGGLYRSKTKKRDNSFLEFTPWGGQNDGDTHPDFGGSWDSEEEEFTDLTMDQIPTTDKTNPDFLPGSQYEAGYHVDNKFLGGLALTDPSIFEGEDKPDEYAPENFKAMEKIIAGYAMADFQLTDRFSTVFGVRLENTSIDYNGFSFDEEEETIGETEGSNSYTNILPGIHLKYDFDKNFILRLAWTNTLARPDYFSLVPFEQFNPEDNELAVGNPELDPTISMNLDLMAEKYFEDIGIVSLGGFYKDIKDFIYEQEIDDFQHPVYGEVDFTTFNNGPSATVYGFEASVQKQLDFLPGLGIFLNYTFTESTTEGIEGREEEDLGLPGTARHMYNASLSYETKRLVLRVSLNHASDYIDELGGEAFEDRYYDKQTFLDANGSYAFAPNWRIFVEANNLTNQPLRFYQGRPELTMQEEYYNVRMNIGIKFDLFGN
jgi:TonB-dependent receptor